MSESVVRQMARIEVTRGNTQKTTYLKWIIDMPEIRPSEEDLKKATKSLLLSMDEVLNSAPQQRAVKAKSYCRICNDNGVPNVEIKFAGRDEHTGKWNIQNPDGTLHIHKRP